MQRKCKMGILILIWILLITTGCSRMSGYEPPKATAGMSGGGKMKTPDPVHKSTIKVWTYTEEWNEAVESFKLYHPKIEVQVEVFNPDDAPEEYLNALSEGNGPDVLIIDSKNFGQYVAADVLQNLLEEPFSAGKYKNDFPQRLWNIGLSLDEKSLLGLPLNTSPKVTFYRADLLEKNGLPSDPESLGKFMEKEENWLEIAKRLKKDGQYIIEWPGDPVVEIIGSSTGIYDRKFNYLRNSDVFKRAADIAILAHGQTLIANIEFFSEIGKRAVQSGTLAMLYCNTANIKRIQSYAPETKGKWRVTRLPLGMYGWAGSSIITMNSQSSKKEDAWKFMEFLATHQDEIILENTVPAYIPAREKLNASDLPYEFLGGQKAYALYLDLVEKMREFPSTPLDNKALSVYELEIVDVVEKHLDTRESIKKIEEKIETQFAQEKNILLGNREEGNFPNKTDGNKSSVK
ncbi:MAG: extracellular solute-binding protein [Clostridia bacterium]|nr:extracellular solute-binding protein [Clostridia bacterium]